MVKGGNTMNLQQPYSDEAFQLQTKILTEDNPHDLERIVNDYLEILAYKKTCRVVDITYQMQPRAYGITKPGSPGRRQPLYFSFRFSRDLCFC